MDAVLDNPFWAQRISEVAPGTKGLQEAMIAISIISQGNAGIVGGSLPRFLCAGGPEPSDVDVFPRSMASYNAIYAYLEVLYGEPKDQPNSVVFETGGLPINLVKSKAIIPTDEDVVDQFDFHVCQFWLNSDGEFKWTEKAATAHQGNVLSIHKITCALGTMARVVKYAKKGYKVPATVMFQLFEKYHEDYERYSRVRELMENEDADTEALAEMYTLMFLD